MYFDTHTHYDDKRYNDDRDDLLGAMRDAGISLILNAASDMQSSLTNTFYADKYPFMYVSAGVHPHEAEKMNDNSAALLQQYLKHPKMVAVGEIGLDYHYDYSPRDIQRKRFTEQLELARSVKKPVIIHEREAAQDTLDIIRYFKDLTGVFHCFSGSWETAKIILDMDWYLSFTGVATFKNARKAIEVIQKMPADRIMIETDSPYLSPVPHRGKRNSSLYLPYISETIADTRGITKEEAAALTMENGKRFFGIK